MASLKQQARAGLFPALGFAFLGLCTVAASDASAAEKKKTASTHAAQRPSYNDPATINQTGEASWYAPSRKKRLLKTSSGEHLDPTQLTAAHATLPLQSSVKVTNLQNGQSVVVRINDRLRHHGRRIIDVTPKAAEALGFKRNGVTRVALAPASDAPSPKPTEPAPAAQPAAPAPAPDPKWEPAGASPY